jgi:NAD(P)-dependent dehydrogenase (short-subunit alcohol dehydrogenase family)
MKRGVIVTGGTGGLGTEVVRRLLRDEVCVVLYHDAESFDALRDAVGGSGQLHGVSCDLADETSVIAAMQEAAAHVEPFALVHLVGAFAPGSLEETKSALWQQMLSVNLTAAFFVFREFVRCFKGESGRIVAISSEATISKGPGTIAYSVAKSALNALVETTANELRSKRITVNALAPSSLDTPAMRRSADRSTLVPLERVTETIAFLLSDAAAGISGAVIPLRP